MLDWFHNHFIAVKLNAQPVEVSVQQLSPCDPQSEQPFSSLCSVPVQDVQVVRDAVQGCALGSGLCV